MNFLRWFGLGRDGDIKPASSGAFDTLPVEIIQHIASSLPVASAAAWALCNRQLSQALGDQYWKTLRSKSTKCKEEKDAFLQLLDRDLPDYLYCAVCMKLHLPCESGVREWQDNDLFGRMQRRLCFDVDRKLKTHQYYAYSFRFEHVQRVMKMHSLGQDTKAYLRGLAPSTPNCQGTNSLHFFEARIISDEVLVRVQHWSYFPIGTEVKIPRRGDLPEICVHLRSSVPYYFETNRMMRLLRCRAGHMERNENPCTDCFGLKRCHHCPTEFWIDSRSFPGQGAALVVTKWMTVGAGNSPVDPEWLSHLHGSDYWDYNSGDFSELGTIQEAFEHEAEAKFHALFDKVDVRYFTSK
jgi:hypothetical protein